MAACGEKYKRLLKNSLGNTASEICGWDQICSDMDAQSWLDSVSRMRRLVLTSWKTYIAFLGRLQEAGEPIEAEAGLFEAVQGYLDQVDDLPPVPGGLVKFSEWGILSGTYYQTLEDGACMLERVDGATTQLGGTPPPVPDVAPPETTADIVSGLAGQAVAIAAIGVGGYLAWKVLR
jgi:hypothetical protein